MNTYFQEITSVSKSTGEGHAGGYIGLLFLFLIIIGFGLWLIFFAKWLKYGPKYKRFYNKSKAKILGKMDRSGPKIQKGAVISNESEISKLDNEITQAKTPQELLAAQNKKIAYEKEIHVLEQKIVDDQTIQEVKKQNKIEDKEEKQKIKQEKKEDKQKAKTNKAQTKQDEKDKKRSEK